MPALPSEEKLQETEELVNLLSEFNSSYQNSPFYIPSENPVDVQRAFESLKAHLNLDPAYFPKELWVDTSERLRAGSKGHKAGKSTHTLRNIDLSLSRMEELARREGQAGGGEIQPRYECVWCER